jgi:hypothetical protein
MEMAAGLQNTAVIVRTTCRKIQNTLHFTRSVFMLRVLFSE